MILLHLTFDKKYNQMAKIDNNTVIFNSTVLENILQVPEFKVWQTLRKSNQIRAGMKVFMKLSKSDRIFFVGTAAGSMRSITKQQPWRTILGNGDNFEVELNVVKIKEFPFKTTFPGIRIHMSGVTICHTDINV